MKIGLVFDDSLDRPDGVQQYVLTIGAWLTGQGHEVHYLTGHTIRTDLPHLHSLSRNVAVTFNGNHLSVPRPANRRRIRQLLEAERFDVLHVMMPYSPMMAARVVSAAVKLGEARPRIFGTFHILPQTPLVRRATQALGIWLRTSLRHFDQVFAVSSSAKSFAEEAFRLKDVGVLPNVIEYDHFETAVPTEHLQDGTPTIMFLGRLVPRKGCSTLLDAVAALRKTYDGPLRLVICGKGPLLSELQAQTERLGLSGVTKFAGFISEDDKPRYLAAADIAVFPSTGGESFGIVLIEAMAAGAAVQASGPVVLAADNPGYATVMEPRPEQLFTPGDVTSLASMLQHLLTDSEARQASRDWQKLYVRQFDVAVVGRRLVAAYAAHLRR